MHVRDLYSVYTILSCVCCVLLGKCAHTVPMLQMALVGASKDKSSLIKAQRKADSILQSLVDLTLRKTLTATERTSLETCITVHMHQKEVSGVAD